MTDAERAPSARCEAAGLDVLSVETVGAQVCVTVTPFTVTAETVIRRLGVPVTVSFGDGSGNVTLWFRSEDVKVWGDADTSPR